MNLWFVVPCHGRLELAEVCLKQLRRTCDYLAEDGITAQAVIIANDENLETARALDFATVEQENFPLGRKWNDGYEVAGVFGEADFFVPLGSDDWVAASFIAARLPEDDQIRCSRHSVVVNEDATKMARLRIPYAIGDGVRIIPRSLLKKLRFRPADDMRPRAIDTSVMERLDRWKPRITYFDVDPRQIVDWKSKQQLNTYERCLVFAEGPEIEPFAALASWYEPVALAEMRALHMVTA